ncbi:MULTISPECIES: hypothetical protein [unclassified Pseudomonas]|uniref:hypothetical protein n=1 Tax=unclassified Pseudomonas TaxID=196821 RepID=UPI00111C575A|nr:MULTISPECIES: hypothetical protein [unclassified Pseudomonas]MDI2144615.1 hypothetical protein [Pseudomonas sp. ITA]
MSLVEISSGCSIKFLSKNINFDGLVNLEFSKDTSFTLGAEGFLISLVNELGRRRYLESVSIHLSKTELEKFGIKADSYLRSACFVNVCVQNVPIYDRHGVEVTNLVVDDVGRSVNMDYGVYEAAQSYSLYALDPYYAHPPAFGSGDFEPSEEDFRRVLSPEIENCIVGGGSESRGALSNIVSSMNLYVFLKEIWENTVHHARRTDISLRYIKVSRVIYNSLTEIDKADLPIALASYLKGRAEEKGSKKYLIIDIVDSGEGIYKTLKSSLPGVPKVEVVREAFRQSSTSKVRRSPVNRGLGLRAAMKCAESLGGLVVMTTSGVLCVNYDYKNDMLLDQVQVFDVKSTVNDLSTSLSLIIPV